MRTLVPAETLVYLETNDLAAALQPIVDSKAFTDVAKSKPDFSALKGVQLAVAVTGFETSEEKLTDEQSVGRVQPRFVAVANTHAWDFQAAGFAEQKLGSFVANIYGSEPTLQKSDKNGGKYFTWTAKDGRKAFALVIGSLIYFGNDESAIEKCLAVRRGESDSIAKTGKVSPTDPMTLASGYVSTDGIAQISNIIGLKFASETSEDSEVQSAIAGILPKLLRSSLTEIIWTARKTDRGIEDKYLVSMQPDTANVLNETMTPGGGCSASSFDWLPAGVPTATCYDLKNAQVAWRSLLLLAQKQTDPLAGKAIIAFSGLLFEPYGISDPEVFFAAGNNSPVTANFSADGDKPVVVTAFIDERKMLDSLDKDLRVHQNNGYWQSSDGDIAAFHVDITYVGGEAESVKSLYPSSRKDTIRLSSTIDQTFDRDAVSVTVGRDVTTARSLIEMLAGEGHGDTQAVSTYFTETRFTKTGMERRTVSDFGLIGSIIAQLASDQ
jgi:hypothetical protein